MIDVEWNDTRYIEHCKCQTAIILFGILCLLSTSFNLVGYCFTGQRNIYNHKCHSCISFKNSIWLCFLGYEKNQNGFPLIQTNIRLAWCLSVCLYFIYDAHISIRCIFMIMAWTHEITFTFNPLILFIYFFFFMDMQQLFKLKSWYDLIISCQCLCKTCLLVMCVLYLFAER